MGDGIPVGYASFGGPGVVSYEIGQLPPAFQACLRSPTPACDGLVGSLASGYGFCAMDAYAKQPYCGCVNNIIPCPMVAAAACANSPLAYRPMTMQAGGLAYDSCKGRMICVNLASVGGAQNVVQGVTQECKSAGSAAPTPPAAAETAPPTGGGGGTGAPAFAAGGAALVSAGGAWKSLLLVVVFVLFVALAVWLATRRPPAAAASAAPAAAA